MFTSKKKPALKLLSLSLVLMCVGCASSLPTTPPAQAEPVAAPRMPKLDSALAKEPLPLGAYLERAQTRRSAMLESLKISPAK